MKDHVDKKDNGGKENHNHRREIEIFVVPDAKHRRRSIVFKSSCLIGNRRLKKHNI